jgi:hypothetical protein
MRSSLTWSLGIAVVALGVALWAATAYRLKPRALISLDIPVSLSAGQIQTGTFRVEPDRLYYVDIEIEKAPLLKHRCQPSTVLATQWELSSPTSNIDRGSSPWEESGLTIAVFCPAETQYSFDARVLPGADCLNSANPRLKVRTHPHAPFLYTVLTWTSALIIAIGVAIFIQPLIRLCYRSSRLERY